MKKVLLLRPDGIGDFVIFTAVLDEYRRVFQDAQIDLLCHRRVQHIVEAMPYFNKIFYVDENKILGRKYVLNTLAIFFWAKTHKYDLLLYPVYSRSKESDTISRWVLADDKVLFDGDNARDPFNERVLRNRDFGRVIESSKEPLKEIERNVEFINALGGKLQADRVKTKLWFKQSDSIECDKILKQNGLEPGKYVCIFPGASSTNKYWKTDNWIDLVGKIISEGMTHKIVFLGGPADRVVNDDILKRCHNPDCIVDITGQLNIRILAKVIESSHFLVSIDTSAVHIAAAVGTPNVCIIGGGHFGRFYPYGDLARNRIVFKKMDCYGCNWRCIYTESKCIQDISSQDVMSVIGGISGGPSWQS